MNSQLALGLIATGAAALAAGYRTYLKSIFSNKLISTSKASGSSDASASEEAKTGPALDEKTTIHSDSTVDQDEMDIENTEQNVPASDETEKPAALNENLVINSTPAFDQDEMAIEKTEQNVLALKESENPAALDEKQTINSRTGFDEDKMEMEIEFTKQNVPASGNAKNSASLEVKTMINSATDVGPDEIEVKNTKQNTPTPKVSRNPPASDEKPAIDSNKGEDHNDTEMKKTEQQVTSSQGKIEIRNKDEIHENEGTEALQDNEKSTLKIITTVNEKESATPEANVSTGKEFNDCTIVRAKLSAMPKNTKAEAKCSSAVETTPSKKAMSTSEKSSPTSTKETSVTEKIIPSRAKMPERKAKAELERRKLKGIFKEFTKFSPGLETKRSNATESKEIDSKKSEEEPPTNKFKSVAEKSEIEAEGEKLSPAPEATKLEANSNSTVETPTSKKAISTTEKSSRTRAKKRSVNEKTITLEDTTLDVKDKSDLEKGKFDKGNFKEFTKISLGLEAKKNKTRESKHGTCIKSEAEPPTKKAKTVVGKFEMEAKREIVSPAPEDTKSEAKSTSAVETPPSKKVMSPTAQSCPTSANETSVHRQINGQIISSKVITPDSKGKIGSGKRKLDEAITKFSPTIEAKKNKSTDSKDSASTTSEEEALAQKLTGIVGKSETKPERAKERVLRLLSQAQVESGYDLSRLDPKRTLEDALEQWGPGKLLQLLETKICRVCKERLGMVFHRAAVGFSPSSATSTRINEGTCFKCLIEKTDSIRLNATTWTASQAQFGFRISQLGSRASKAFKIRIESECEPIGKAIVRGREGPDIYDDISVSKIAFDHYGNSAWELHYALAKYQSRRRD